MVALNTVEDKCANIPESTCPNPTLKFGSGSLKASSTSESFLKSLVISLFWFLNFLKRFAIQYNVSKKKLLFFLVPFSVIKSNIINTIPVSHCHIIFKSKNF